MRRLTALVVPALIMLAACQTTSSVPNKAEQAAGLIVRSHCKVGSYLAECLWMGHKVKQGNEKQVCESFKDFRGQGPRGRALFCRRSDRPSGPNSRACPPTRAVNKERQCLVIYPICTLSPNHRWLTDRLIIRSSESKSSPVSAPVADQKSPVQKGHLPRPVRNCP